jgi:hypothetical protein
VINVELPAEAIKAKVSYLFTNQRVKHSKHEADLETMKKLFDVNELDKYPSMNIPDNDLPF